MNHAGTGRPWPFTRGKRIRAVLVLVAALGVAGAGAAQAQPGDAAGSLWGSASVDSLAATAAYGQTDLSMRQALYLTGTKATTIRAK